MNRVILVGFFWLFTAFFDAGAQTTTVVLMRHAEKSDNHSTDPDLSEAGRKRAASLATQFGNVPFDTFFSTPFKRTRQTLEPLAAARNLEITEYNPMLGPALAAQILNMENRMVAVAGHSNTIPALVNALIRENRYLQIPDSVYGDVWIVTLTKGAKPSVLQLKL